MQLQFIVAQTINGTAKQTPLGCRCIHLPEASFKQRFQGRRTSLVAFWVCMYTRTSFEFLMNGTMRKLVPESKDLKSARLYPHIDGKNAKC